MYEDLDPVDLMRFALYRAYPGTGLSSLLRERDRDNVEEASRLVCAYLAVPNSTWAARGSQVGK